MSRFAASPPESVATAATAGNDVDDDDDDDGSTTSSTYTNRYQGWYQKLCRQGRAAPPPDPGPTLPADPGVPLPPCPSPERLQLQMHFQRQYQQQQELQKNCRQEWWQRKSAFTPGGLPPPPPPAPPSTPAGPPSFHTPSPAHFYPGVSPALFHHQRTPHPNVGVSTPLGGVGLTAGGGGGGYYPHAQQERGGGDYRLEAERARLDRQVLERERMIRAAHLIKHDAERRLQESQQQQRILAEQGNIQQRILQLLRDQELAERQQASGQLGPRTPQPPPAPAPPTANQANNDLGHKIAKLLQAFQQVTTQQLSTSQADWEDQVSTYNHMLQAYRQGDLQHSYHHAKRLLHQLLQRRFNSTSQQQRAYLPQDVYAAQQTRQQGYYPRQPPPAYGSARMSQHQRQKQQQFRVPFSGPQPSRSRRDPRLNQSSVHYQSRHQDVTPRLNQSSCQFSESEPDVTQEIIYQGSKDEPKPVKDRRNSTPCKQPGPKATSDENGNEVTDQQPEKSERKANQGSDKENVPERPNSETSSAGEERAKPEQRKILSTSREAGPRGQQWENRNQPRIHSFDAADFGGEPRERVHDWEQLQQRSQRHRRRRFRRHPLVYDGDFSFHGKSGERLAESSESWSDRSGSYDERRRSTDGRRKADTRSVATERDTGYQSSRCDSDRRASYDEFPTDGRREFLDVSRVDDSRDSQALAKGFDKLVDSGFAEESQSEGNAVKSDSSESGRETRPMEASRLDDTKPDGQDKQVNNGNNQKPEVYKFEEASSSQTTKEEQPLDLTSRTDSVLTAKQDQQGIPEGNASLHRPETDVATAEEVNQDSKKLGSGPQPKQQERGLVPRQDPRQPPRDLQQKQKAEYPEHPATSGRRSPRQNSESNQPGYKSESRGDITYTRTTWSRSVDRKSPKSASHSKSSHPPSSSSKSPTGPQSQTSDSRRSPRSLPSPPQPELKPSATKAPTEAAKKAEGASPPNKPKRRRNRRRLIRREDHRPDERAASESASSSSSAQLPPSRDGEQRDASRQGRNSPPKRWQQGGRYEASRELPQQRRRRYQPEWDDSRAGPAKKWRGEWHQSGGPLPAKPPAAAARFKDKPQAPPPSSAKMKPRYLPSALSLNTITEVEEGVVGEELKRKEASELQTEELQPSSDSEAPAEMGHQIQTSLASASDGGEMKMKSIEDALQNGTDDRAVIGEGAGGLEDDAVQDHITPADTKDYTIEEASRDASVQNETDTKPQVQVCLEKEVNEAVQSELVLKQIGEPGAITESCAVKESKTETKVDFKDKEARTGTDDNLEADAGSSKARTEANQEKPETLLEHVLKVLADLKAKQREEPEVADGEVCLEPGPQPVVAPGRTEEKDLISVEDGGVLNQGYTAHPTVTEVAQKKSSVVLQQPQEETLETKAADSTTSESDVHPLQEAVAKDISFDTRQWESVTECDPKSAYDTEKAEERMVEMVDPKDVVLCPVDPELLPAGVQAGYLANKTSAPPARLEYIGDGLEEGDKTEAPTSHRVDIDKPGKETTEMDTEQNLPSESESLPTEHNAAASDVGDRSLERLSIGEAIGAKSYVELPHVTSRKVDQLVEEPQQDLEQSSERKDGKNQAIGGLDTEPGIQLDDGGSSRPNIFLLIDENSNICTMQTLNSVDICEAQIPGNGRADKETGNIGACEADNLTGSAQKNVINAKNDDSNENSEEVESKIVGAGNGSVEVNGDPDEDDNQIKGSGKDRIVEEVNDSSNNNCKDDNIDSSGENYSKEEKNDIDENCYSAKESEENRDSTKENIDENCDSTKENIDENCHCTEENIDENCDSTKENIDGDVACFNAKMNSTPKESKIEKKVTFSDKVVVEEKLTYIITKIPVDNVETINGKEVVVSEEEQNGTIKEMILVDRRNKSHEKKSGGTAKEDAYTTGSRGNRYAWMERKGDVSVVALSCRHTSSPRKRSVVVPSEDVGSLSPRFLHDRLTANGMV